MDLSSNCLTPLLFSPQLNFDLDRGVFPVVIQAVVDEGDGKQDVFSVFFSCRLLIERGLFFV